MWLTVVVCASILYLFYRFINFWILHPWQVQQDFSRQGIPGQYIPIVGDILQRRRAYLADKPFSYVEEASRVFGDYYHASFGPFPCLHTSDPGLVQCILKTNHRFYQKSTLAREILAALLGCENVLLAEGDDHVRHRRLINPVFQHQNINSMISLIANITFSFLEKWTISERQPNYPLTLDISRAMSDVTLDIVTGCVFGAEAMEDKHIHEVIHESLKLGMDAIEQRIYSMIIIIPIINQLPLPSKRCIDKCRQDIKDIVQQIIDHRKQGLTKAACKG